MANRTNRTSAGFRRSISAIAGVMLLLTLPHDATSFPIDGRQTVLPAGSELNEDAPYVPHEMLSSEYRGDRTSYVVALGGLAFNSPTILGDVARRAGISCATCHIGGANNAKLFIPGMSIRPGTFDTTGSLFNPKADNHVFDAVRIPSLRGARYLAPYGNDGRITSLRDFVRNVIVNEFAGPEPSATLLDAITAYVREIDFLPNPRLGARGRLNATATESERRGEALFSRPFPHDPQLSCAGCHDPTGAFVDHRQHDVGSGGMFKTPSLLNADLNAPYFHDGRYATFDQVVDHFDRVFDLGLSSQDRSDLVAYLHAVGDARQPYDNDGVIVRFKDIEKFSLLLRQAIAARDHDTIALATDTLGTELRELAEQFPDHRDAAVTADLAERRMARAAGKEAVISLRRVAIAASTSDFDSAAAEYKTYYDLAFSKAMPLMSGTEPWSLFNPAIRAAHNAQRRQMLRAQAPARPQHVEASR